MRPRYSGSLSVKFWKQVRKVDDKYHSLYLLGCCLQDLEGRVLQVLEDRKEILRKRSKK